MKAMWITVVLFPSFAGALAQNAVLYHHHTHKAGEQEIKLLNDLGQDDESHTYIANLLEYELSVTDRWVLEFYPESYIDLDQGAWKFSGFRVENRWRLFKQGTFINPVLYVEYADLQSDHHFLREVVGFANESEEGEAAGITEREKELETRLILGRDFAEGRLRVNFNLINESEFGHGSFEFGYAVGFTYKLKSSGDENNHGVTLGIEMYGGLGDTESGLTADPSLTRHFLALNFKVKLSEKWEIQFGGHAGLTDDTQHILRSGLACAF